MLLAILVGPSSALSAEKRSGVTAWAGAKVVTLLTPALAQQLRLTPASQFEVVDGEHVIILTRDGGLYDLSGRQALPAKEPLRLRSFAISDGLVVGIRDDRLGWYEDGALRPRIRLPSPAMFVIAGTQQRLYVYGPEGKNTTAYLMQTGRVIPLLEIKEAQISAFTAVGDRLFFGIDNMIFTAGKTQRAALLFVAPEKTQIRSIAIDQISGVIYFSAGDTVYAMRASSAISILQGLAGYIHYSKNALFVLDPERKRLVKMVGLERLAIGVGPAPPQQRSPKGGPREIEPMPPSDFKQ